MNQHTKQQLAREAGFTLLEVLAALTILAMTAALVMPRLASSRQDLAVQVAALELVSSLKATRAAAMATSREQALVLDASARKYFAQGTVAPRSIPPAVAVTFQLRAPADAKGNWAVIRFFPDGSASGGDILLRSGNAKAGISVDWLTGRSTLTGQR